MDCLPVIAKVGIFIISVFIVIRQGEIEIPVNIKTMTETEIYLLVGGGNGGKVKKQDGNVDFFFSIWSTPFILEPSHSLMCINGYTHLLTLE